MPHDRGFEPGEEQNDLGEDTGDIDGERDTDWCAFFVLPGMRIGFDALPTLACPFCSAMIASRFDSFFLPGVALLKDQHVFMPGEFALGICADDNSKAIVERFCFGVLVLVRSSETLGELHRRFTGFFWLFAFGTLHICPTLLHF